MKSRELIAELQKLDPEGDIEVCVGNVDIYFAEKKPAYWDGRLQLLVHDESLRHKAYSIIGAKVVSSGYKIDLRTMSVEDVISEDVNAPIDLSGLGGMDVQDWEKRIEKYRAETREIDAEIKKMA